MKPDGPRKFGKFNIFSGLGRYLTTSFLVFALIPMAVFGVFTYERAYENLREAAETALKTSAVLKTREIQAYFDGMMSDLRHLAETRSATWFLEFLEEAYVESGQSNAAFVKSYKWALIVDDFGADLKNFRKAYSYYDVFLINNRGDILFTVAGKEDLGANLFTAPYSETKFAVSVRKALDTGRPSFSDYDTWEDSDDAIFGFITDVVVDGKGNIIGAIAFQFPIGPINDVMQAEIGLGRTAETYLVGPDFSLRSNSVLDPTIPLVSKKIGTHQTQLLKQHLEHGHGDDKQAVHETAIYKGPHGKSVLGVHHSFMIQEIRFSVIAEIEKQEAFAKTTALRRDIVVTAGVTVLIVILFSMLLAKRIVNPVLTLSSGAKRVEEGDFSRKIKVTAKNEIGDLANAFNAMQDGLGSARDDRELQDWFKTGQMELGDRIRGIIELTELGQTSITFLAKYTQADVGAIYITDDERRLQQIGTYAFPDPNESARGFDFGQGIVGQAALDKERRILTDVPENYLSIRSGLGETGPASIVVSPFIYNDKVLGVIELGAMEPFSEKALLFLEIVSEQIAITVHTLLAHLQVRGLLEKTQAQATALQKSETELRVQEEELRQTNVELEEQTQALQESQEKLQSQQEELEHSNADLEEQSQRLEEQKNKIEQKNRKIEKARRKLEEKTRDLELSSRYKSEFLANMSHELRTPLNSILLLSRLLSDNRDGTLSEDHLESAATIYSSGKELLVLINEVLDLSKVEAGKMELNVAPMGLAAFGKNILRSFRPLADEKGLTMSLNIQENLPSDILTDKQRVEQVVRNFMSNAVKFTHKGGISLDIRRPAAPEAEKLDTIDDRTIGFYVKDTGIGISKDKQKVVFEAFQQADGTTSRNYGGTGLGLSISRELAKLLGGQIDMVSTPEKGSTFVLYLPEKIEARKTETSEAERTMESLHKEEKGEPTLPSSPVQAAETITEEVSDDRKTIQPGERIILLIEDDPTFLKILRDLSREQGFQCLVAENGEIGLQLAEYHKPSAIILDIGLPGMDGWTVMARLKENSTTRHIPVHVISATDRPMEAMKMGAVDYLVKPVSPEDLEDAFEKLKYVISKPVKDLLVVEDDADSRRAISKIIGNGNIKITSVDTADKAYKALVSTSFDCIILDLNLPDMRGTRLLEKIRNDESVGHIPIIVYTGRELTSEEKALIDRYSESTIIKGVDSHDKLLDETALFLHRVEADLPEAQQRVLKIMHDKEHIFAYKKVLVVDDDMRNVYSLKKILEEKAMKVVVGQNGIESLACLEENPDIALVLMDIMMPEMDGYEAMRRIRRQQVFKDLPIIALTAKAMKGDRVKCIEAGANDYLAKPVDVDRLLSMMRVWLYGRN